MQQFVGVVLHLIKGLLLIVQTCMPHQTRAQCNLGVLYEYGDGVEQDLFKAIELYSLAIDNGSPQFKTKRDKLVAESKQSTEPHSTNTNRHCSNCSTSECH